MKSNIPLPEKVGLFCEVCGKPTGGIDENNSRPVRACFDCHLSGAVARLFIKKLPATINFSR